MSEKGGVVTETKPNADLRMMMRLSGVKQWEGAREVGLSATYFCTLMRSEMPTRYRDKTIRAIQKLYIKTEENESRENA